MQGRLMRVQSFRPRKVVSVQLLSSDLSYDCQVCSDAVVDESQKRRQREKYRSRGLCIGNVVLGYLFIGLQASTDTRVAESEITG